MQHTAAHCSTLQHTAAHCSTLQHTDKLGRSSSLFGIHLSGCSTNHRNTLQHTQHTALQHTATHHNTLQHAAADSNTQQHTDELGCSSSPVCSYLSGCSATHCSKLQHTAAYCSTLRHNAAYCNTLYHAATHCDTSQHTATHGYALMNWVAPRHMSAYICRDVVQRTAAHCSTL